MFSDVWNSRAWELSHGPLLARGLMSEPSSVAILLEQCLSIMRTRRESSQKTIFARALALEIIHPSMWPHCRLSLPQSEAIVLQRSNQLKYHWTVFQPQQNPTSEIWEAINIPQSDLWSDFFCSRQIYRFLVFASARYFFWFLLACCDVLGTGWAISWKAFELQDPCRLAYRTKQPT